MIRCRWCGHPVGVGSVQPGDLIVCAKHAIVSTQHSAIPWTRETVQSHLKAQMNETRAVKAGKYSSSHFSI